MIIKSVPDSILIILHKHVDQTQTEPLSMSSEESSDLQLNKSCMIDITPLLYAALCSLAARSICLLQNTYTTKQLKMCLHKDRKDKLHFTYNNYSVVSSLNY